MIKPVSGDIFDPLFLGAVRDLTDGAWRLPYTMRVDSITNYQHSYAEGDDLTVEDLVLSPESLAPEDIARIRTVADTEPFIANRLVSPDGATTSINVTINRPNEDPAEIFEIMDAARVLVAEFNAQYPDARVAMTGVVPLNNAFSESGLRDIKTLVPLMYVTLLLVMVLLLRSISGTIASLLVIGFSAMTAMGLAGWVGIKLTPISMIAPTIILTIAIADSIHILITMLKEMRGGRSKQDAIVESLRVNFGPVFLTSLTTVIGFLSLNFSDAPPFGHLGNITAVGVTAAWLLSIFFLPAVIAVLPLRVRPSTKSYLGGLDGLARFVIARRRPVLIGMSALVVGLLAMIPRIELNDQFVNYFDESLEFRQDSDFAMANLPGIYQVNFSLPAQSSGGISDPEYLAGIDAFTGWLRQQAGVTHVQTLSDVFRRLNRNMNADDPSFYRLPEERDLAAQYLLLYELSLPYGLDLNNQINVDKSSTRVIVTLDNVTTAQLQTFDAGASAWLDRNFASAVTAAAAGPLAARAISPFVMFAYISERNINNMLVGSVIAFLLISATLVVALRSLRLGLVSLVPNLVPAGMAFGVWAIFVGQVGLASAVVAATSLGIIVDATVHFLSKYLRARREGDRTPEDAVRYAFSTVGTALWVSAAILIAGFAVLSLSTFKINADLGQLTALAIAMAMIADFLLLPALLLTVDRREATPRPVGEQDPALPGMQPYAPE